MSTIIRCDGGCGAEVQKDSYEHAERWRESTVHIRGREDEYDVLHKDYDLCAECARSFINRLPPWKG